MANWGYTREEQEPRPRLTGKQRVVIVSAEEGISNKGNPMITIGLRPSGCKFTVRTWLVKNDSFNKNATQFFDAFPEIEDGDFNFITWIGCEGAAMLGEDESGYLKVRWFLSPEQAANLPPFEGEKPERQTLTTLEDEPEEDGEFPF